MYAIAVPLPKVETAVMGGIPGVKLSATALPGKVGENTCCIMGVHVQHVVGFYLERGKSVGPRDV